MKKRHSEEQVIRILREAEAHEVPIREVCRQHNVSEQTFYRWRDRMLSARPAASGVARPDHSAARSTFPPKTPVAHPGL
ncbi:MAG: hypothetical protein EPN40_11995 [Rhodanobacteraceae bacterium]|nr:MAG: hypothetical protein EPN40_11995 [Rhodanobacteraceae bacterium]